PHTWALFLRYQAQAERQYRLATQEFDRLRALRPDFEKEEIEEIPNEPISPTQPESTQPDPAPETNPIGGLTPPSACDPPGSPPRPRPPPSPPPPMPPPLPHPKRPPCRPAASIPTPSAPSWAVRPLPAA